MVVVAAVDESAQASAVLEEADTLADRFDDEVHALHVMKRSEAIHAEEDSVGKGEGIPVSDLRERAAAFASKLLEEQAFDAPVTAVGRIGDPASEIVTYAEETDARYIVVSPRQRSQTGKMLFGSVAQSVLLNANCPVVSLRVQPSEE
ncbi:universal stress protein [Halobellus rufus]|uniref:universal stress protein n=1 Tax=Halobellus rufus TaxID=1448860 RepID=UPI0006789066|nr:universal stress protein [Halobellus rufus]